MIAEIGNSRFRLAVGWGSLETPPGSLRETRPPFQGEVGECRAVNPN